MANQVRSVWTTHAGLHAFAAECVARGLVGRKLTAAIEEQFGVTLTPDSIYKHLSKVADETLIAPRAGFARPASAPPPIQHPKGWEPHVEIEGDSGVAVSQPIETDEKSIDEEWLIRQWNLDPKRWRIVGHLNCRRWQASFPVLTEEDCHCKPKISERHNESRWLHYYKANLERIDPVSERLAADLIEDIRNAAPLPGERPTGDAGFVVNIADLQMGKADGDGVRGTVNRFRAAIPAITDRVKELRRIGRKLGVLYVFGMGDLIENCDGHYAMQAFTTELNKRDQVKVARRLIYEGITEWSRLFDRVVVGCVGGNHGEFRKDGKAFTDFADNADVEIFEQIEERMAENPRRFGHINFAIPDGDLSLTFDIFGKNVGITHGHAADKASGSSLPQAKLINWWMKQAHGKQPIGDCDILFSAHYHHLSVIESGAKVHIQCPALEGGSEWWRNQTGQDSRPGILTSVIGADVHPSGCGYRDLEVM